MTTSPRRLLALLGASALVVAACGGDDSDSGSDTSAAPSGDAVSITVGSANFPGSQLLAEVYAQALEGNDIEVTRNLNIGSREVYYAAIEAGEIDLLPEYTNSLLSFTLRQADPEASPTATNVDEQVTALGEALPEGLQVLAPSTAEDKDVIVCRAEVAEEFSLTNLTELAAVSGEITLGAPPEFEERAPFGLVGFADIYGAEFAEFVPLDIGGVADSLIGGSIDCGNLFTTMSVITTEGLVPLDDDKTIVPNEAVIPLIRSEVATADVTEVLEAVSAALNVDNLKAMMVEIEVDKADPAEVAATFVADNDLG
jgi:osmoprotectant transport system substrate-binding protein